MFSTNHTPSPSPCLPARTAHPLAVLAELLEAVLVRLLAAARDHVHKVRREHERHPLAPDPVLVLKVAQDVAKVDMKQLAAEAECF